MNEFRTIVRIVPSTYKIALNHRILTVGSCFSDAIGGQLLKNKFSVSINPFGVLYNPPAIHQVINYAVLDERPFVGHYIQNDDIHLNFDLHSSFAALKKEELEEKSRDAISAAHDFIKKSGFLLITYGTAWVYTHKQTGRIVANCHKQPSHMFEKSLLNSGQIIESFSLMHNALKKNNPKIKIILTVSPVRHLKDTLQLNSVSKAVLRQACHGICETHSDVEYFPAYEIMQDDLRDYRFYKSDMIHPTEQAEEYIWNRFTETYMDSKSVEFIKQWQSILPALHHRPFHPASSGHQIFLRQTLHKLEQLKGIVDVDEEIHSIRMQLLDSQNPKQTSP
jgi:hypothetical protein